MSVRRVLTRTPPRYSDVVGDLLALSPESATIESRAGVVTLARDEIALARLAPPSTADQLALERVIADGWRAHEVDHLGGWLLRANAGFTGRANSVLPIGRPDRPLPEALAAAHDWYAARGLPLQLQIPTEARRLLDAELGERGWPSAMTVHVMVARLDRLAPEPAEVKVTDAPDDTWLARFRDGAGLQPAARGVLTRHERVGFAAIQRGGVTVAIGRGTVDSTMAPAGGDWLGVTAVEVDERFRRQGLARAIMAALWRWGAARGAVRSHLEVAADNYAAVSLYEGLGYWRHHDYHYRREPSPGAVRAEAC